jgi:hypothetical protein
VCTWVAQAGTAKSLLNALADLLRVSTGARTSSSLSYLLAGVHSLSSAILSRVSKMLLRAGCIKYPDGSVNRGDLYTASTVRKTGAVDTQPGGEAGASAPLLVVMERQQPSQGNSTRSTVQPSTEWLANTFRDLGVSQRSRQASGSARQPESADPLTLQAWNQALTSQFLQQVAERLTHWTNVEMKHRSKD